MAQGSKEIFVDFAHFKKGLYALDDTTDSPYGTARIMNNIRITDKGGLAPRQGTQLLGTQNASTMPVKGLYNFRKSFSEDEILIKAYDTTLEFYSKDNSDLGWNSLSSGSLPNTFTSSQEFGFVTSLVNTDNQDYVLGSNRYEPYFRWRGSLTRLTNALVGGETTINVATVLKADIYDAQTATSSSATTLSVSSAPWAADQWTKFYVHILTGTYAGSISQITATTTTQITFASMGGDPGSCNFEIRDTIFPAVGSLWYNNTQVAYTTFPTATSITVTSAVAAANGSMVTIIPDQYPGNPRGNRIANYLNRVMVGNVRSGLARGSGGAMQGYSAAGSYFVSKVNNPYDFGYSAARVAGEGDLVATPYGGNDITDIVTHEDSAYIFKPRYIEAVQYSQDTSDLAVRTPLKSGIGSLGRVIKGANDIYFITWDNRFTSLGRVKTKDIKPETENIGYPIKRILEAASFGDGFGIEYKGRIYIPAKSSSTVTANDVLIIYNLINQSFEGIWTLPVFGMEEFGGDLYFGDSTSANVYQMLTGTADVVGSTRFPITAQYATQFLSLASIYPSTRRIRRSYSQTQQLSALFFEGYIRGDSTLTFQCWKDFANSPFLTFDFNASENEGVLDGQAFQAFLGSNPLSVRPEGTISEVDEEGYRHFQFRVYFPFQYGSYFSIGFQSSELDTDYEMIRLGMRLNEVSTVNGNKVKVL